MDSDFLSKTEEQEWVARRVSEVEKHYSAYLALSEHGVELPEESTSYQILCPFHGDKNKPSARYYAKSGNNNSHFYCFKCKLRLNGVNLYAKFNSISFYDALSRLERRYGIKIPKKPTVIDIPVVDRGADYKSKAWNDIPRYISIIEQKMIRKRHLFSLEDYVKVNRLIDNVLFDYDKAGEGSEDMVRALDKASSFVDNVEESIF